MAEWTLLLMFIPTFFLISVSPGLCMMLAMSFGASLGIRRTLWVIGGELAGVALIAITALLGYTQVLSEQPLLLQGFKYVGAIYLLWMGITSWCGGHGQMSAQQADLKRGELMLRGFTVAISNPKSWLFMMTLLPPFLSPSMSVSLQIVLFVTLITVIECVNLLLYAYGGQRANRMLQERGSVGLLGRLSAVMMVGIALFWLFG